MIFLPIDDKSPYYPHDSGATEVIPLFERQQWHCWMCITGTVRRSTDNHLIHCNIDTDLQIESQVTKQSKSRHTMLFQKLYTELQKTFPTPTGDYIWSHPNWDIRLPSDYVLGGLLWDLMS